MCLSIVIPSEFMTGEWLHPSAETDPLYTVFNVVITATQVKAIYRETYHFPPSTDTNYTSVTGISVKKKICL